MIYETFSSLFECIRIQYKGGSFPAQIIKRETVNMNRKNSYDSKNILLVY